MPARLSAATRVPCPAEPTDAETCLPRRSASARSGEPGETTTELRAPRALDPVTESIAVSVSGLDCARDPLMSNG